MQIRIKKVISNNVLYGVLFLGYYFLNTLFKFTIACPFYKITHLYCPGCGITRMFFSLFHLDFKAAFWYNPLVFILLPFFFFYYIYTNVIFIFDKENTLKNYMTKPVKVMLLVVVVLFGILRNIPALSFLAP